MVYEDRFDAGRRLAPLLQQYHSRPDAIVLALPRGGVPVGFEVARALQLPLDVFVVRKLGAPGQEELAMGAVASGGVQVVDYALVRHLQVSDAELQSVIEAEMEELERRQHEFRGDALELDLRGKTLILVDDGLATGATMKAAVLALKAQNPHSVVVAVPVGANSTCLELQSVADEVVCLHTPTHFRAVGEWYENFDQTTDEEVRELLARSHESTRLAS
jgi:putative phosphoribosyl transferase